MTKHTCNGGRGPAFGRKTPGCPRCDELAAGAEPRTLNWVSRKQQDEQRVVEIRDHFRSEKHRSGCCNGGLGVCTFGDW